MPAAKLFSRLAIASLLTICQSGICLAIIGCGKQAVDNIAANSKAFETANPAIRADWGKTISAVASRDYATAILTCRKLQTRGELTPKQLTVVNDMMTGLNKQMLDGLHKGDPNAIRANDEVRQGWRHPHH